MGGAGPIREGTLTHTCGAAAGPVIVIVIDSDSVIDKAGASTLVAPAMAGLFARAIACTMRAQNARAYYTTDFGLTCKYVLPPALHARTSHGRESRREATPRFSPQHALSVLSHPLL